LANDKTLFLRNVDFFLETEVQPCGGRAMEILDVQKGNGFSLGRVLVFSNFLSNVNPFCLTPGTRAEEIRKSRNFLVTYFLAYLWILS
jgi:hypothetical protein